jgi:hypothetical protein
MLHALAQSTYNYTTSSSSDASGGAIAVLGVMILFYIGIVVLMMVSGWKVFEKAGRPGWGSLVPYHNIVLALEMAGKPGWWILVPLFASMALIIPLLGLIVFGLACIVFIVYAFIVSIAFAKAFGKGTGFGVFMVFLFPIALPILAFGKARYVGPPVAAPAKPVAPAAAA